MESGHHGRGLLVLTVCCRILDWGDMPNRLKQPAIIEPVHPIERGMFHLFHPSPGALVVNPLRHVQPDDCLGQPIVI